MRHAQARNDATDAAHHAAELSVLETAVQRVARRRTQDAWLATIVLLLAAAFAATFAWYVLDPAMKTLVGP